MNRRVFLLMLVILSAFACKANRPQAVALHSPNVLLITIDTLRPDHLSCYGSTNRTYSIDAIARSGVMFRNAFCQVPLTFPSHTAILTGLFPSHHGVHQNGLEAFQRKEFLISNAFRKNGYKTGAVVSTFVLDRKFGLSDGFDIYDDRMERKPEIVSNFDVERPGSDVLQEGQKILASFAGQKWFMWLHFYDPHTPYAPPEPLEGYDGEIQFVDQQIGALKQWMHHRKIDNNLVIAILGDHGESLGEHGEATHGFFVYNSTLRIPLILSYPGIQHKTVNETAAAVDVASTLLQLAGIKDPLERDGESLEPLIKGSPRKNPIYFESQYAQLLGWNGLQGIIRNNWKLISTTRSELYDWTADSLESNNLYSQKEEISRALKSELGKLAGAYQPPDTKTPDTDSVEKLRSLGYISSNTVVKRSNADPKDKIATWGIYETSLQLKNSARPADAIRALESLTAREPDNNFFRLSLASSYREAHRPDDAVAQLKIALKQNPSDSNAYNELALAYKNLRNYKEALRAEEAALAINGDRTEFHSLYGNLLTETGQFQKAAEEFSRVLKLDPNNAVAWNNYGNALRELGAAEQAAVAYRKSIELSPHYAYPLNGLATILIRQDRTSEAIPYMEKALELDPKFVEVYLNLGIAYQTLHQNEKARTLYTVFLKVAPDSMKQEKQNARLLLSQLP